METRRDVFQALADPTRRDILGMLVRSPQNVNAIAEKFEMSRQAVSLHVKILSQCGVISVRKSGRERLCNLEPEQLARAAEWLEPFKKLWEARFSNLDHVLENLKKQKK